MEDSNLCGLGNCGKTRSDLACSRLLEGHRKRGNLRTSQGENKLELGTCGRGGGDSGGGGGDDDDDVYSEYTHTQEAESKNRK